MCFCFSHICLHGIVQFHLFQLICFINLSSWPRKKVKYLFTVYRQRDRQREGEVRWCQRWDFADSIFTHQTELFPVSTWPNSRSHHLRLLLSVYSLLLFYLSLPPGSLSVRLPFKVVNFHGICFPSPARVVCLYFPRHLSEVLTPSPFLSSQQALHPFLLCIFLTLLSLSLNAPHS